MFEIIGQAGLFPAMYPNQSTSCITHIALCMTSVVSCTRCMMVDDIMHHLYSIVHQVHHDARHSAQPI